MEKEKPKRTCASSKVINGPVKILFFDNLMELTSSKINPILPDLGALAVEEEKDFRSFANSTSCDYRCRLG